MIDLSDHSIFMKAALAEAQQAASEGEVPVGAVITAGGRIIARAHNLTERLTDVTAHAEIQAITAASNYLGAKYLQKCTLYVTLEPCPMCAGAMVLSRVERCVYGCSDPKGGFLGTLDDLSNKPALNHRFDVVAGIEEHDCAEALRTFFRALRAKKGSTRDAE